jgi:hypothetical protein
MTVRIGYKASAEQFGPRELLDYTFSPGAITAATPPPRCRGSVLRPRQSSGSRSAPAY